MKILYLKLIFIFFLSFNIFFVAKGIDSLNFNISLSYSKDLSDTYGGGGIFSGGFSISKSWFGAEVNYGHFQSQPTYILKIPIEELNISLDIPFDEMSIMEMGSLSAFIRPIRMKWIESDILFGICYGRARYLCFKGIQYSFSLPENRFTYLFKEYQLVKTNHFGYQVGFNISFFITKKFGLQLNSRIQDLSNGGTFFFVGSGIIFRL